MYQLARSILSVLLICAALFVFTYGKTTVLVNSYTLAAFMTVSIPVVGVALYFSLLHKIPFLSTLRTISLPLGILVSLILAEAGGSYGNSNLFIASLAAAITAGFLAIFGQEGVSNYPSRSTSVWEGSILAIILSCSPMLLCYLFFDEIEVKFFSLFAGDANSDFWFENLLMGVWDFYLGNWLAVGLIFFAIFFAQSGPSTYCEKAQFAACYGLILVTAFSVIQLTQEYFFFLEGNMEAFDSNWNRMTREEIYSVSASATLNTLIYMTQIYIAVVFISITKGEIKHLSLRNWHLAEGYIFLTFILLAPQSVLEVLGTSGSFDPTAFSEKDYPTVDSGSVGEDPDKNRYQLGTDRN